MTTRTSKIVTVLLAGGLLFGLVSTSTLNAQNKKSTRRTTTKKAKYAHRLPSHFRQIGISEEQKGKVYKIQDKYHPQIDALKKQLAALREKEMSEIEGLLSTRQKSALSKLRNKKKGTEKSSTTRKSSSTKKK